MTTTLTSRPRYEGANIRTWIGFKHFMYIVEEAVLEWLRERGYGARELFHTYGLGVEIVDCSVQLPAVLEIDDEVRAEIIAASGRRLTATLSVVRDGAPVTVLRGKLVLALIPERDAMAHASAPTALAAYEVPSLEAASTATAAEPPAGSFLWSWRAPYFYCHFSDRVQHSGYVRALEEVVDRFLADRGLSVGRLLAERSWIPVVSRARVQLISPAHMEETVHTYFTVLDILGGVMFDGRMDCYVERDGARVHTATAQILHGYAISRGPEAGGLARLDDDVVTALLGRR